MRLATRLTIGKSTEEFISSEITLVSNVYVTLRIRGVHIDICKCAYQAMLSGDVRQFRFHEGDISIQADEIAAPAEIPPAVSA